MKLAELPETVEVQICSRCHGQLETDGHDGGIYCPNAMYPNATKHGDFTPVTVVVPIKELHHIVDFVADDGDLPCMPDHHGYCQQHNLEEDCSVKKAKELLAADLPEAD